MTTATLSTEIDCHALKTALDQGEITLVDVRAPEEHARVHIPGATLIPLEQLRPEAFRGDARRIVVHCKSGIRGTEARGRLAAAGIQAANLRGGIDAWRAAGLPVQETKGVPISVMRQVQIVAGSMVLAGVVLGTLVSPWFLILSGFVGAGLVVAGSSGFCGMAALLRVMPWNRAWAAGPAKKVRA